MLTTYHAILDGPRALRPDLVPPERQPQEHFYDVIGPDGSAPVMAYAAGRQAALRMAQPVMDEFYREPVYVASVTPRLLTQPLVGESAYPAVAIRLRHREDCNAPVCQWFRSAKEAAR